ncbi:UDP-2,4-diacetamido-2,4,6-trideoxy-beta-L-altropyranose hydrolase [Catenovulum sediminis]|uniref:UDP-2,4-diacetamido-2,4, 6-trideoxy-beta-L-altropyranose hydrolase n=1 Tax=Catenovulum sediminis TaxID=1740262 RepID=A0ABV1RGU7_9ALTE
MPSKTNTHSKVVFLTQANSLLGSGHLMRCIALAQACEKARIAPVFALDKNSLIFAKQNPLFDYPVYLMDEQQGSQKSLEKLAQYCNQQTIGYLFIDGYNFNLEFRQQLFKALRQYACNCQLISIDDNAEQAKMFTDWILNPSTDINAIPDYSKIAPGAKLMAGHHYRLLRKEFSQQQILPLDKRSEIIITMGGTDPFSYSVKVLNLLAQLNLTAPVRCIVANGFEDKTQLIAQIEKLPSNFSYTVAPQNMAAIFANAKLAISAAGTAQFELYAMQTPAILIILADNQYRNTQNAAQDGWAKVLDFRQTFDSDKMTRAIQECLNETTLLHMQSKIQPGSAEGAKNVINTLLNGK